MQIIFQDPVRLAQREDDGGRTSSARLSPFTTWHDGKERAEKVKELLEVVGLDPYHARRYPHGVLGRAEAEDRYRAEPLCASSPRNQISLIEPVSALDVSIRSQILNLLKDLQEDFGLPTCS